MQIEMSPEDIDALKEENKRLTLENKKLTRLLKHEQTINERNRISAEAKSNLSKIISAEKSRLEQYMNLLLGNCPDIILLFDSEGHVVYASESYLVRSRAFTIGMIRGKSYKELLEPVATEAFLYQIHELFQNVLVTKQLMKTAHDIDFEQNGSLRHYLIEFTPMMDEDGKVEGVMAFFYDTTETINAQRESERARELAEQSTKAKSEFLSRMSHEMRTPMNAIIGMTVIAKASNDIERKEYCMDKISEASQHLLGVINDILDMSKIEADKFELSLSEFNFEKMLQRVINVINFRIEEREQNLFINIGRDIPANIISDEQRLAQVITNLLSNSAKFTPEHGNISLTAKKISEEQGICTLQIVVKDSGIGISQEQQKHLFSSFEQADGSISRKFGGTGLGLAISKRIVELMDGRIWIESEIGQGASFVFEIKAQSCESKEESTLLPGVDWDKLHILVVDDAPEILELFKIMLEPYGINCETADCAAEVLRLVDQTETPFSIIFADWRMPGMDGVELTRNIKRRCGEKPVVVMISAADLVEIEADARAAGVARFLQKPLFPSDLVNCINECIGFQQEEKHHISQETSDDGILSGKRILLAEDVDINREILAAIIEHTGLDVDFATDGVEAVEKFSADPNRYGLILMDIQMPNMDGYEATARIRSSGLPNADTIPIIAMTANVFREDIERCLESGMNNHLGKPIDAEDVIAKLKRYLL